MNESEVLSGVNVHIVDDSEAEVGSYRDSLRAAGANVTLDSTLIAGAKRLASAGEGIHLWILDLHLRISPQTFGSFVHYYDKFTAAQGDDTCAGQLMGMMLNDHARDHRFFYLSVVAPSLRDIPESLSAQMPSALRKQQVTSEDIVGIALDVLTAPVRGS